MTLMKSRRCIAFPKPKDRVNVALQHSRSNQEIATGGIGIIDHFAQQQSKPRMSLVGHFRQIDPLPTLSVCPLRSDRLRTFAPQRFDAVCQSTKSLRDSGGCGLAPVHINQEGDRG
jgi:hypothetical protein